MTNRKAVDPDELSAETFELIKEDKIPILVELLNAFIDYNNAFDKVRHKFSRDYLKKVVCTEMLDQNQHYITIRKPR